MAHGLYGFVFALPLRVDPKDYIGVIEEGSRVVIHLDPEGRVLLTRAETRRQFACRQLHSRAVSQGKRSVVASALGV
jgi:hypothetical protein